MQTRLRAKPLLKDRRVAMNLKQRELIDLVNATLKRNYARESYAAVEQARRTVDPEYALAIARILKMEVTDLFE